MPAAKPKELPSYYDPEGETIFLRGTAAEAAAAPKKRRRGPELNDVVGYVGSATLLVAYLFVANQILSKHPVVIDLMNLLGSACVGLNCYCKRAHAPMFLEIAWFGIAFAALVKHSL